MSNLIFFENNNCSLFLFFPYRASFFAVPLNRGIPCGHQLPSTKISEPLGRQFTSERTALFCSPLLISLSQPSSTTITFDVIFVNRAFFCSHLLQSPTPRFVLMVSIQKAGILWLGWETFQETVPHAPGDFQSWRPPGVRPVSWTWRVPRIQAKKFKSSWIGLFLSQKLKFLL